MEDRVSSELVNDFLRASAPSRERVALVATGLFVGFMALSLSLNVVLGERVGPFPPLGTVLLAGYLGGMTWAIRRGFWASWLPYVNTALPLAWVAGAMAWMVYEVPVNKCVDVYGTLLRELVWIGYVIIFNGMRGSRTVVLIGVVGGTTAFAWISLLGSQHAATPVLAACFAEGRDFAFLLFVNLPSVLAYSIAMNLRRQAEGAVRAIRAADLSGKYLLHEKLGAGGMAETFRATYSPQGGFEKEVAIKRILPQYAQDPAFAEAFRREARTGAMLNHPSIVQVFDAGTSHDQLILSMEYVRGLTLSQLIRNHGELPLHLVAYVGAELAMALDYIHTRPGSDGVALGLVHRDLNPPNVLLSVEGEVKLADFGVAAASQQLRAERGRYVGKVSYMAPEQAAGKPEPASDFFALGATLHEAITGQKLFSPSAEENRLRLEAGLPPPGWQRKDVPVALDLLVMRLLHPDPTQRLAHGPALRDGLLALDLPLPPYPRGRVDLRTMVREAVGALEGLVVAPEDAGETQATAVSPARRP